MIHIDKKEHQKKKRAVWRYRMLGGIPIKKGNFTVPPPATPTERRCLKEIIHLLVTSRH